MTSSRPILAIMNQKGGVGKSTVAALLAEWFSLVRGKSVCLVDLDEQCNSTKQFVGVDFSVENSGPGFDIKKHPDLNYPEDRRNRSSIADIFYGEPVYPYDSWINTEIENGGSVDVLCGHPTRIEEINNSLMNSEGSVLPAAKERLKEFFNMEEVRDAYDLYILDTGPSKNVMFRAALRAATHLIVPFVPEDKAIQGITQILSSWRHESFSRSQGDPIEMIGLLPNMVRNIKVHKKYLGELVENQSNNIFPWPCWLSQLTAFPATDILDAAPKSVFSLAKSNAARAQATAMCLYAEHKIYSELPELTDDIKNSMEQFEDGLAELGLA